MVQEVIEFVYIHQFDHVQASLKTKIQNFFFVLIENRIYMTNIKQPRLHNIHVRNISGEIEDNIVDTSAKRN